MVSTIAVGIAYYLLGTGALTSMALAARGLTKAVAALASGQVKLATAHVLESALDPLLVAQRECKELGMTVGETAQQALAAGHTLADWVLSGGTSSPAPTLTTRRRRSTAMTAMDSIPAPAAAASV